MKYTTLAIIILAISCTDDNKVEKARLHAQEQMTLKVREVVEQLRNDCDSSLLQTALSKADSIRNRKKLVRAKGRNRK